jgi:GDP-D-glucose phosphorylase
VKSQEKLFEIDILGVPVSFVINDSPVTKYHVLICPEITSNHPQILNENAIKASIEIMKNLKDPFFKIGYNGPGAQASVNHLHVQLMYIERKLYVEKIVKITILKLINNFKNDQSF